MDSYSSTASPFDETGTSWTRTDISNYISSGYATTAGSSTRIEIRLPGARNSDDLDDGCAGVPAKV